MNLLSWTCYALLVSSFAASRELRGPLSNNDEARSVKKNDLFSTRIIGGTTVDPLRYEYHARLRVERTDGNYRCHGTLIAADIILTAAHCTPDSTLGVTAWVNETQADIYNGYEYEREVETWIPHPSFDRETLRNDIGILKLKTAVPNVKPATYNGDVKIPYDWQAVTTIGMGKTLSGRFAQTLMEIEINVIPNSQCNHVDSYSGQVDQQKMICAGVKGGGQDACSGDSGGPLIVRGKDARKDVVAGIVSWGRGCANEKFPGVYTRVYHYSSWITDELCKNTNEASILCIFRSLNMRDILSRYYRMIQTKAQPVDDTKLNSWN
mmetsp:Transcript_25215/g.37244  ORF Transcript_25215/g.37244 Transcript_25215/m.37244 type:complete len:323 (+) Transcript_25215:357-1325(+)